MTPSGGAIDLVRRETTAFVIVTSEFVAVLALGAAPSKCVGDSDDRD